MAERLVAEVEALLHHHDPIGIAFVDNPDEYHPEAASIVARLPAAQSVEDVHTLVHEEFVRWFGGATAGPANRYEAIAQDVWSTWRAAASNKP